MRAQEDRAMITMKDGGESRGGEGHCKPDKNWVKLISSNLGGVLFRERGKEGRMGGTDFQWLSRSRFWLTSFTLPDPPGSFSAILHCLLPSSSSSCFSLHLLLPPVVEDVLQPVVELTDHREWTRQCQRSVLSLSVGKGFLHPEGKPTSGQSKGSHSRPLEVIRLQLSLCKKKKNVVGLKGHSNKTELRAIR